MAPLPSGPAAHDHPPAFSPGDVLCARFEILRFLAQGGMGEVYEARDLELGETVALKTIRPEIAGDARVLQRFKREITLARRVTHPNVCRIFDLFHHGGPGAPYRDTTFLAMELLRGETLAARLSRTGPLSTDEALPLVEQMVKGLAAAHQAGIVHRDLKPGNVILVAGSGTRAVVTDFGLARSQEDPGSSSSSSASLGMVGTSAYMSPEQVEGRDVTAVSDVYSLGVVIYEMVTGVKPFLRDTALATAVLRLKEKPPSPRVHREDLDARWEKAILRCLEVAPEDRFQTVERLVAALDGTETDEAGTLRAAGRRYGLVGAAALAATVAVAAAVTSFVPGRGGAGTPSYTLATATAPRRSVAVLGFKNLSGRAESAWLSTALSEMLGMELAAGETLRIIPGENVARMKVELSLTDAESLAPDTLARIRANLGTDLVVLGSYLAQGEKAGERLRLDLRVQDTSAGELVASITETGTEAELLDFVSRGGSRLREKLGIGEATAPASRMRASFPSNQQAARLYSEGLARLRAFDALAARDLLRRAVTADPTFPLAHAALAEAWSALGYDVEARREAKAALDLSARLRREERLAVEGRHHAISSQWPQAVETYHLLWGFFPDNVEYGLRLAAAQTAAGKGQDALATVDALRRHSADPRIDLAEAMAAASLSQVDRRRTAAARAVQRGEAQGAPLLAAEARLQEAGALAERGEAPAAIAVYEKARDAFARVGDRRGEAAALMGTGLVHLNQQQQLTEAERLFEQGLAINRSIGHQKGVSRAVRNLGAVLSMRGDHAGAGAAYEKGLAIDRERGDRAAIGMDLYNIGFTRHHQGELARASELYGEALHIAREINDVGQTAMNLQAIGWISLDQGELPRALGALEEALAINRRIGRPGSIAFNLFNIAYVLHGMADLEGARKRYEESLTLRGEIGETGPAMENRVRLAAILLDEGRAAEAEPMAQAAVDYFQAAPNALEELLARIVLTRCLLARGKLLEAQDSSERMAALARTTETRAVVLAAAVAIAEVDAAMGRPDAAIRSLQRTLAEARRVGYRWVEFEARLALGQVETKHGNPTVGRARLRALEKEARDKRFLLIARKAQPGRMASR